LPVYTTVYRIKSAGLFFAVFALNSLAVRDFLNAIKKAVPMNKAIVKTIYYGFAYAEYMLFLLFLLFLIFNLYKTMIKK